MIECTRGGITMANYSGLLIYVAMFAVLYFILIRPQKKRKNQLESMRSDLKAGDKIVTVGGLIGQIVSVKDDDITIEVGVEKSKLVIKKWGIYSKED